jgi:MFS family permease
MLVPLSILGGIGNGYAGTCYSTLLVSRTPDAWRGRVSATANAVVGGAQGVSLLVGGALAAVLSPRAIYAIAGLFGLAAAIAIAVFNAAPVARTGQLSPRWSEHRSTGPGRPRYPSP